MRPFPSACNLLSLCLVLAASPTVAQQYPDRALTMYAGFPAGGLVDIVARAVAEGMKKRYPSGVIVVNRAGAGGAIAVADTVQARPDGYSVVLTPLSSLVIGPQINPDLRYKTPDDYEPVINVVSYFPMLAVRAEAPWKTAQEFVADAKANPGKLRVGSPGEGTSSHLNLEEFNRAAQITLAHVPFAGWGQSAPAVLGGHIEAVVAQPGEVKPQVDGKKMRLLVVYQNKRHQFFPDVPTAKELGWDVANGVWYLIAAPKGTPSGALRHIHDAAKDAIDDPAFQANMAKNGIDIDYRPAERLKADLWAEYKAHTEILRRAGLLKTR